jgi:hypothetical protein
MILEGMDVDFQYNTDIRYDWLIVTDKFIVPNFLNYSNILFGPHLMPQHINTKIHFLSNMYFNCLSEWNKNFHQNLRPNIKHVAVPFPVDIEKFKPKSKTGRPVIYIKRRDPDILYEIIEKLGNYFIVFSYEHKYQEKDFLSYIEEAPFAIWLGCHESQGFAFEETLSCNTPIFVIDTQSIIDNTETGVWDQLPESHTIKVTAASYFDNTCGMITSKNQWQNDISFFLNNIQHYIPREFVIKNLSPKACLEKWHNIEKQ